MAASRAHVRSSAKATVRRVKRLRDGTEWCRASHAYRPEHDLPALQWRWERHVRHHRHADKVMQRFTHFVPRARGQRLDARAQWVPGATEPGDTGAGLHHRNRRILKMHVTGERGLVAWHQQPAQVHAVAEGGHVVALAATVPVIPLEAVGQLLEVRLRERRSALHQPLPGCQVHRASIRGAAVPGTAAARLRSLPDRVADRCGRCGRQAPRRQIALSNAWCPDRFLRSSVLP